MVRPDVHAAYNRRIGSEVLLHRTQATILGRGASLDYAGNRGGPTLGRLPEGTSDERARCPRGIPVGEMPPDSGSIWRRAESPVFDPFAESRSSIPLWHGPGGSVARL